MTCFTNCITDCVRGYDTFPTAKPYTEEQSKPAWIEYVKLFHIGNSGLSQSYPPIEIGFDPLKTFPEKFPKVKEDQITSDFLEKRVFINRRATESDKCRFQIEHPNETVISVSRSYIDTVAALQRYVAKIPKTILIAQILPAPR
jgi:hypothetical protein